MKGLRLYERLFNANIILDWLLERGPTFESSSLALRETIRLGHTSFVSASAINDIYYVLRKSLKSESKAKDKISAIASLFLLAKVDDKVIFDALTYGGRDFEDDIMAACAVACQSDCLVTNNVKDYSHIKSLKIHSPKDYLSVIAR